MLASSHEKCFRGVVDISTESKFADAKTCKRLLLALLMSPEDFSERMVKKTILAYA